MMGRLGHMADESGESPSPLFRQSNSTAMTSDSELGLPPPAKRQPPAPTTITDIGNDLLREIFLRLPSLPSLVRAALACPTFLHAVRSSPAFRRRFQLLHLPQILGFFLDPMRTAIPAFAPLRRLSDLDLDAAIRGADFFLTRLPKDSADSHSGWEIDSCHGGYVVLVNYNTNQIAAYNPLTHALDIFPMPRRMPREEILPYLEFYIVFSEEKLGVFRMVCIKHRKTPVCKAVFSSASREWTPRPKPEDGDDGGEDMFEFDAGRQVNSLVYWKHKTQDALILNTATLKFSSVDLSVLLGEKGCKLSTLGHTKDGKLCMVGADDSEVNIGRLFVWFWRADDDGVEKWMLAEDTFPLGTLVDDDDATVNIEAVIDGFVYLSAKYVDQRESLLSLCLETEELNILFDETYASPAHPYVMAWPNSLICNMEDSETKVTVDCVADDGPVGTEESPSVLVAALQSYKAALINGDVAKVVEIEAFFTSYRG